MADQSSDTPGGVELGGGEPSMEDILASIRKIIAEDDNGDQQHVDIAIEEPDLTEGFSSESLILDTPVENTASEAGDDISTEDLVVDILSDPSAEIETDFNPVSTVMSELSDRLSDGLQAEDDAPTALDEAVDIETDDLLEDLVLSDGDDLSDLLSDNDISLDLIEPEQDTDSDDGAGIDEETMGSILDSLIEEVEVVEPTTDAPDQDILELVDVETAITNDEIGLDSAEEPDSDLDIVKALMADLTDTSFLEEETEEISSGMDEEEVAAIDVELGSDSVADDFDFALALDDGIEDPTFELIEETPDVTVPEPSVTDDILNDILDLTISDQEAENLAETASSTELLLDDIIDEAPEVVAEEKPELSEGDSMSSLLKIAEAAEADADQAENVQRESETDSVPVSVEPSTEDILNELDLALAEMTVDDVIKDDETEFEEIVPDLSEKNDEIEEDTVDLFLESQETIDMPRIARKETIIDEVTESAAAGAFEELSKAVEEKAVFVESGPRIGDIVQEALRPMLKEWLDENLKGIVERAVAKEVKRIASGK